MADIHILTGRNSQKKRQKEQLLAGIIENPANLLQFLTLILHPPWQKNWKNHSPYPLWHTFGVQNPTLPDTLLENPTLCGTEIGQNGPLAVLATISSRMP